MTSFTIFLLTGFSLLIALTIVSLAFAVVKNFKTGQVIRVELGKRVEQLRYGKMLAKRNINSTEYIHLKPLTEIETGLRRCQQCTNTNECDDVLSKAESAKEPYKFCPNAI